MQQRTDSQIQSDIVEHLRSAGLPLTVAVERGVLRLEGIVTSEEERQAALDLAAWVPGVEQTVDDMELRELDVDSPGALFQSFSIDESEGVTDDPMVAAAEGLAYFPPTDPPVRLSDDSDEIEVASGFMSTALDDDEAEEELVEEMDEPVGDGELVDRVLRNLKEDGRTTHLNLYVNSFNGTVVLVGAVQDNLDSDSAVEVAANTAGVEDVIDRTVLGYPADLPAEERPVHRRARVAHVVTPNAAWRATVISNRHRLEEMRRETEERARHLERDIRSYGEAQEQEGAGSSHEADLATDLTSAAELTAELNAARDELAKIDEAFERMDNGTYGICVDTGRLIEAARLRANPLAIRTAEAQRRFEEQMNR